MSAPAPSACWSCRGPLTADPFCPTCRVIQPPEPDADFFRMFGLEPAFDLSLEAIEPRYRDGQQQFHPDRYAARSATERRYSLERVTRLNEAWRTLKDPLLRAEYLLHRSGWTKKAGENAAGDPALLMEVMELREALEEVDLKRADAGARLESARADARARIDRESGALAACFRDYFASGAASLLDGAARMVDRVRYFQRFLEEVERLEERLFEQEGF